MTAPHEAEVTPHIGVADEWACRCLVPGCGLFRRFARREDAERCRDEHREATTW